MPSLPCSVRQLAALSVIGVTAVLGSSAAAYTLPVQDPTFDASQPLNPGQCLSGFTNGCADRHCGQGSDDPAPGWTVSCRAGVYRPTVHSYTEPWPHGEVGFTQGGQDGTGQYEQTFGALPNDGTYTIHVQAGCRLDKACGGLAVNVILDDQWAHQFKVPHLKQVAGSWTAHQFNFTARQGQVLKVSMTPSCHCTRAEADFDNFYLTYRLQGDDEASGDSGEAPAR